MRNDKNKIDVSELLQEWFSVAGDLDDFLFNNDFLGQNDNNISLNSSQCTK